MGVAVGATATVTVAVIATAVVAGTDADAAAAAAAAAAVVDAMGIRVGVLLVVFVLGNGRRVVSRVVDRGEGICVG